MSAGKTVLEVRNLSVELQRGEGRSQALLSDVAFTLQEDEVIGIIGESGSGKTVLSRTLVNWVRAPLRVTSGSLLYRGRDLLRLPESEMQRLRGREIARADSRPELTVAAMSARWRSKDSIQAPSSSGSFFWANSRLVRVGVHG